MSTTSVGMEMDAANVRRNLPRALALVGSDLQNRRRGSCGTRSFQCYLMRGCLVAEPKTRSTQWPVSTLGALIQGTSTLGKKTPDD